MGSLAGGLAIGKKPSDYVHSVTSHDLKTIQKQTCCDQGVWNRREIQMTRPALPYDYTCYADGT